MDNACIVRCVGAGAGGGILHDVHDEGKACHIGRKFFFSELVLECDGIDLAAAVFHLYDRVIDDSENPVIELVTGFYDLLDLRDGFGGHEHTGEDGSFRHEFRHHLEHLGGIHGSSSLEAQDAREKRAYLSRHGKNDSGNPA